MGKSTISPGLQSLNHWNFSAEVSHDFQAMLSHGQLGKEAAWRGERRKEISLRDFWPKTSQGTMKKTCQYEKMCFILSENAWKMLVYHHVPPLCNFSWAISHIYPSKHRSCPPHFGRCTQLRQLGLHVPERLRRSSFKPKIRWVCKCLPKKEWLKTVQKHFHASKSWPYLRRMNPLEVAQTTIFRQVRVPPFQQKQQRFPKEKQPANLWIPCG